MALWLWTVLISAPFGYGAYRQAVQPDWKLALSVIPLGLLGLAYIFFGAPDALRASIESLEIHPHNSKFRMAVIAVGVTILAWMSAVVGHLFREKSSPLRIGVAAFLAAFVFLNIIYLLGVPT